MSGSIVNVLTPNGRRQNVKVQPNTAILKVKKEQIDLLHRSHKMVLLGFRRCV